MNDCPPPLPSSPAKPLRSSSQGCLVGCLVVGAIIFMALIVAASGIAFSVNQISGPFMAISSARTQGSGEYSDLSEVWVSGDGDAKVARISINGVILLSNERWGNSDPVDLALASIRRATRDDDVKGLLVEINSPGGGITASDIFYNALMEFKRADPNRRVVLLMNDLAASGAYYIACAADEIIAHPTSLTGSIGVIMQSYNVSELAKTIGITDITVKSGRNKDLLNPFKPVDQAQVEELVQPIVDNMHARFTGIVSNGRGLPLETVLPLADGRLFDAQTALDNKLIDGIGYRQNSELRMKELLGDDIFIIRYEESLRLSSLFRQSFMRFQEASLGVTLKNMLETPDTKFMYLWRP